MPLTTDVLALADIDDQEGRCIFAPAFFVALISLDKRAGEVRGMQNTQSVSFAGMFEP